MVAHMVSLTLISFCKIIKKKVIFRVGFSQGLKMTLTSNVSYYMHMDKMFMYDKVKGVETKEYYPYKFLHLQLVDDLVHSYTENYLVYLYIIVYNLHYLHHTHLYLMKHEFIEFISFIFVFF